MGCRHQITAAPSVQVFIVSSACGLKLARRWFLAIFRQTTQNIDSYLIYFLATNREIMCVFYPMEEPRRHTAFF